MFQCIITFLNSKPSNDDWFGVHIRQHYQNIKKLLCCKHRWASWLNKPNTKLYLRVCTKCGKEQKLYGEYKVNKEAYSGSYIFEWVDQDKLDKELFND